MATTTAHDVLWPDDENILARVVILHVGQGNSALLFAADGDSYKTMLVDINLDAKAEGIDVPRLVADLVGDGSLDVFTNTHPHGDHLCGVDTLDERVTIGEVWHSGHVPGPDDCAAYDDLQKVIKHVKDNGGGEIELDGSRYPTLFGEVEVYILAPAEHVKDEIADEDPKVRRERIHEHCAVLRVGSGDAWIMLPGDADREAWENHITDYHRDRLPSRVFAAPHHGSKSFFYKEDDTEAPAYTAALEAIDPEWVIVSAPRQDESRFEHPHNEAMELYAEQVGADNVLHTGQDRYSFICDIFRDGTVTVTPDDGALVAAYKYDPDDTNGGERAVAAAPSAVARRRPDVREPKPFA